MLGESDESAAPPDEGRGGTGGTRANHGQRRLRPPGRNPRTNKPNAIKTRLYIRKLHERLTKAQRAIAGLTRSRKLEKGNKDRNQREKAPRRDAEQRQSPPPEPEEPGEQDHPPGKRKRILKPVLVSSRPSRRRSPPSSSGDEDPRSPVATEDDEQIIWSGARKWASGPQPKEFPAKVEITAKRHQWLAWRRQFEAHLILKGYAPPSYLATYLYTTIGSEMRQVIDQEEMRTQQPSDNESRADAYERLLSRLDAYFLRLSDRGTDIRILNTMKQEPG